MAKIVDVTDVPEFPGAGLLHFDDGRPPLMALPEIADEHRERLGMSAMQDGVAGPGAADPDAWKTKFGGTLGKVLPDAPAPPPPAPVPSPAPPQPGPQGAEGVPPMLARPPEPAPPAAPGTDDVVAAANDAARRHAAEELLYGKATPGSAGRAAGYAPQTQKMVTEAGPAYDTHAAGDRLEAAGAVLDAQMAKAASEKQQADAMAAHAAAQNAAAQRQIAEQQAEMVRRQQAFQQEDSHLQRELADYSEAAKPDPNKFWSTPAGAYSGFLSIIGQALGAFGSSLGHTENYAFKAAQQKIQMEMAAQEKAYDSGRGDRKNALARLADYYHGDMDKAKLALSQSLNKVAETETLSFAAQSRSKDITANAQVLAAQFQQQQLLNEQARAELAQGKTTTTVEDKYQAAQGASGPGRKPLTDAERAAALKITGGAEPPKGIGAKDQVKTEISYGEKKRDLLEARQSVEEEAKAYGLKYNRETGEIVGPDGKPPDPEKLSISGVGRVHMPSSGILSTEAARAARRARMKTTSAYRKAITGVAYSPSEALEAEEATHGETEADALRTLQERAANLSEVDRSIDAEHPPEIVEGYRQRQGQTNVERNKRSAAKPKVTAYAPGDDTPDEPE